MLVVGKSNVTQWTDIFPLRSYRDDLAIYITVIRQLERVVKGF